MRIGELFLFVIAIITLFYLLNLLFRKLEQQLLKQSFFKKGLKLKNYQMLNKENMKYILGKALFLLKLVIFFIIIFVSIPFALKLFPSTQMWAEKLLKLVLDPLSQIGNAILD